ncbi:MAG: biotin holocarboxylase synthetase [Trichoglossum hirsutum]|nr:MAG: biotin holocarboxylase synthetase [Trichoglossum hirsutum]
MRVNVLVYSGDGSSAESVQNCLYSLRRLLFPNYAVIPITLNALIKEPWASTCALLVVPEGAGSSYHNVLKGEGDRLISQYVRAGGKYLGFGEGGGYMSKICIPDLSDRGNGSGGLQEHCFFPGEYHRRKAGEPGVKELRVAGTGETFRSYYKGSGVFVDVENCSGKGTQVLASFTENIEGDGRTENAAVVYCKVAEGAAILASPQLEFAPTREKCATADSMEIIDSLLRDDEKRGSFLKTCLENLYLKVGPNECTVLTPSLIHISSLTQASAKDLADSWREIITTKDENDYILCGNDTFYLEKASSAEPAPPEEKGAGFPDSREAILHIQVHSKDYPAIEETPFFNHIAFYASLQDYQSLSQPSTERFGRHLLYGEVLTSTNTLLEKNHSLLHRLPTGFTAIATLQTAGRGRGSNVWLSPLGCLLFSTCVRHPVNICSQAPPAFVQYLAAMAIVEGVKSYDVGYEDVPVRLKWPNDIYAEEPTKLGQDCYTKIGGILVQCSGDGKEYYLVVGVGLNAKNEAPTTSLNHLINALNHRRVASGHHPLLPLTQERLLARILVTFEDFYVRFCESGWSTFFEDMYHRNWLHSNQIVTLETLPSAPRARILGITRDFALLRVEELSKDGRPTGQIHELQPDGNSFDFFRGLVKRKG